MMEIPGQTFPISAGMIYRCLTGSIEIELYSYLIVFLLVVLMTSVFDGQG